MSTDEDRTEVALLPPAPGLDLTDFPSGQSSPEDAYRAHQPQYGPWFFSSHDNARFNLALPNGTCYFADAIGTAVREYFGRKVKNNSLTEDDAKDIRVTIIHPPADANYAHANARGASTFSVTSEIGTAGKYAVTRQWAEAFRAHGFDGVRYNSRFNAGYESWALFGLAGATPGLAVKPGSELDGVDAVRAAGIAVIPDPPAYRSLSFVTSPPAA